MGRKIFSSRVAIIIVLLGFLLLFFSGVFADIYVRNLPRYVTLRKFADVNAIEDWMTLHYIAKEYVVSEQALLSAIGITTQQARHQSIAAIARKKSVRSDQIISIIKAVISSYKPHPSPFTLPQEKQNPMQ